MNISERQRCILNELSKSNNPVKGQKFAEKFMVTRQVIVKDIAILRAQGVDIIATPEGYIIPEEKEKEVTRIVAVLHNASDMKKEIYSIIKYGGCLKDVVVEHPVYGELKGMLMIKTIYDLDNFIKKFNENGSEPLLVLTGGVHIHTITTSTEEAMDKIIEELRENKFLVE